MRIFHSLTSPNLVKLLQNGGVAVLPTDTLYGVVALAANKDAVERVYKIRGREPQKPCIILVASLKQITDTNSWTPLHLQLAKRFWPGPLSLVVPITNRTPEYLHRGTQTIAYRVPANPALRQLLQKTGPLIAPSANPQGGEPATTAAQAQEYFGDNVDGYVDGGEIKDAAASTVVAVQDGQIKVLRPGDLQPLK